MAPDFDPGKTIPIVSMQEACLADHLNRPPAARDAEFLSHLSQMRFHGCGRQTHAFCDLRGLKVIRDAFQASPFLRRQARDLLFNLIHGRDRQAIRSPRPEAS